MFGFGKATDPVCGMKVEKKTAISAHGRWFCAQSCADTYGKGREKGTKRGGHCCH